MESSREGKMDMQEMMEAYQKLAAPSEQHEKMARWEGQWDVRMKTWMGPDQPPQESRGTAEFKSILGGRFLQQTMHGEMMEGPYNGAGFLGYDKVTEKYVTVWIDDMSTSVMVFEGTADPEHKTITQTAHYDDPIQGPMDFRTVTTVMDDDTMGFEMFSTGASGTEEKMMEIVYTRK